MDKMKSKILLLIHKRHQKSKGTLFLLRLLANKPFMRALIKNKSKLDCMIVQMNKISGFIFLYFVPSLPISYKNQKRHHNSYMLDGYFLLQLIGCYNKM